MKRKASAILLVIGLFVALVALNFIFFIDTREAEESEQAADRSSYRSTPYGTLAFYTLLEQSGYPVTRLEYPFNEIKKRAPVGSLVVIAPPPARNPSEEEFESLNEWVKNGGLLVVIDREIKAGFGGAEAETVSADFNASAHALQPTPYTRGVGQVKLSPYATRVKLDSLATTYHLGGNAGAVLADAKVGRGRVVLLTDPYVVANNGISEADNVLVALNLFADRPDGKIAFDEYHHGYGSSESLGVMAYFRGTPLPWMMWQGALVAALMVYTYGRRFARPLPLRRERRTTNLEYVSSMANITRLARASDLAMQNIYSEFRSRLCRFSGVPARTDTPKLAAAVARRARVDERELHRLLFKCEKVAGGETVSDSEMLSLVTRIREIESRLGL